jgi:nucleoside-diphosphate-sugar epimerase
MTDPPGQLARFAGVPVLVTGATGFLGRALLDRLTALGACLHVLVRPGQRAAALARLVPADRLHQGDVADPAAVTACFRSSRPRYVFHAVTGRDSGPDQEDRLWATNVEGARNIAAAVGGVERLVVLGSSLEYGRHAVPLEETMTCAPESAHGRSRAEATRLYLEAHRKRGLAVVVLRIFSVYGPGEPCKRLIPTAIRASLGDEPLPLTRSGYRRDFVFVDDVVEGCLRAASTPRLDGQIVNIGTGLQTTNEVAAALVGEVTGRGIVLRPGEYAPHETDAEHWVADTARCERLLRWRPRVDLRAGLERTVRWFKGPGWRDPPPA